MILPLTSLLRQGTAALALSVCTYQATVFTISTKIPVDVSPCQEIEYEVTVGNSSAQGQAGGSLQYCLPAGLRYAGATGLAPLDVSNPRCPVFTLPALPGNGSLNFRLRVRVDCGAKDQGDIRDTIRIVSGGVPQDPLLGSAYNVRVPVLSFQPGTNWNYAGAQGDVFTRTFSLRNEGFGAALQLFIIDPFANAGLELISTTGAFHGDTLVLTAADLGPDSLLSYQESVTVTQQFRLTACGGQTVIVTYGWACPDGQVCTFGLLNQYTVATPNTPQPNLVLAQNAAFQSPRPCEPSPIQLSVRNLGNAPAYNLDWRLGFSQDQTAPVESWAKSECFPLSSFSVGSAQLNDLNPGANGFHHPDLSAVGGDPDGPGGLSDLDGDGSFDDLAPGGVVLLNLDMAFVPGCKFCNNVLGEGLLIAQVGYVDTCATQFFSDLNPGLKTGVAALSSEFSDDPPFLIDAGQVFDFTYFVDGGLIGLPNLCPNDSVVVTFHLPVALRVPPLFQPTLDGTPVSFWTQGDSLLYLLLPDDAGDLKVPLLTVCPPDIDDSGQCTPPYSPRTYQMPAEMTWTCGNGCDQPLSLVCIEGAHFTVDCPRPDDTTQMHGLFADTFTVRRISLGFQDNAMTLPVDPMTPGLVLDVAIPYDTVLFSATAKIEGTAGDFFDTTRIEIYYWNGSFDPYFYALSATVLLEDVESGQTLACPVPTIGYLFVDGYHIWDLDLQFLTQPGGCWAAAGARITPGDRLHVRLTARTGEILPTQEVAYLDDLRVRFPYRYHDTPLLCKMKNTQFAVVDPGQAHSVVHKFPDAVCDDLEVQINFYQGSSEIALNDLYPGEIRPLVVYDTVLVALSPGYEFRPGSVIWEYIEGENPLNVQQLPLADPTVVTLPSGAQALRFVRPAGLPVTDYLYGRAPASLVFFARMLCPPDTTQTPVIIAGHKFLATVDSINLQVQTGYFPQDDGPDFNELALTSLSTLSANRLPVWTFDYCNGGGPSFDIPEPLIYVQNSAGLQGFSASDITNPFAPQALAVDTSGSQSVIHSLPLDAAGCRTIELKARLLACNVDTLWLRPGFQCSGAAPCLFDRPLALIFAPSESLVQINVTGSPDSAVGLCDPIDYELKVINVGQGPLYDLQVSLQLPLAGQVLVPGSCVAEYNGQTAPLPDPQPGPGGLVWTLNFAQPPFNFDALPGVQAAPGNAVAIRFQVETNCDYIDGTRFRYAAAWSDACGAAKQTSQFVAPPILIEGAPTGTNSYQIVWEMPDPASFCAENTVRLSIVNPGDLGPTGSNEKIRVVAPAGFAYVAGSLQGLHNGPVGMPVSVPFGDAVFLYFDVPAGVVAGDSIVFTFQLKSIGDTAGCSVFYPFLAQMLQSANVACGNATCSVDFNMVEKQITALFEKPSFELGGLVGTSVPLDANLEKWHLNFFIKNTAATVPGGGALQVQILLDQNADGQLDPSDPVLKTIGTDVEGLAPGASLTVLDSIGVSGLLGCSGLWVALVDSLCSCSRDAVFVPFVRLQNAGPDHSLCFNTGADLGAAPQAGYQYEWIPASPYLGLSNVANPNYYYTGNFNGGFVFSETLVLKTTRPQGCVSFDTLQITTHRVDVALTPVNVLCHDDSTGSVTSLVQGAQMPVAYAWNPPAATGGPLTNLPAGDYTLTVTDALGCTDEATASVTEPPVLTLALTGSDFNGFGVPCHGDTKGSVSATAGGGAGGYQFQWSNGSMQASQNNLPADTYTVVLTDANGCSGTDSILLAEPPLLYADFFVGNSLCPDSVNGSITVLIHDGVKPYTVNGQPSTSVYFYGDLPAGQYSILIKDANGCSIQFDTVIQQLFSTFSHLTDSVTCFGGTDGGAQVLGSGFSPFMYFWSGGSLADTIAGVTAGTYTCTVLDALGCYYQIPVDVGEPAPLAGEATPIAALCHGDSTGRLDISITGGTQPYTYAVDGQPTGPMPGGFPAGTYAVSVTDANGCTFTLSATVTEPTPLGLALSPEDAFCHDGDNGQVDAAGSGGVPPYQFLWSTGATGPMLTGIGAGDYAVTMSDANGCTYKDTTAIGEPEPYEPVFEVLYLPCVDLANGIFSVSGLPPGTLFGLDKTPHTDSGLFEKVAGGAHVVQVKDTLGCLFEFDFDMPTLAPELGFVLQDTTIHLGDSVLLTAVPNPALGQNVAVSFLWLNPFSPLSGCDTCAERWVQPFRSAVYRVQFTTKDGCEWLDEAVVRVQRDSAYAPNVLWPGAGEEENRHFTLYGRNGEITNLPSLRIFDRWGELLFERFNLEPGNFSLGWDGFYKSKEVPPGVYVWFAEVEYVDGLVELVKGDVTVVR